MQRADDGGRGRVVEGECAHVQARPPESPARSQALEAIDELQALAVEERRHRRELPVLLERAAQLLIRGRVAQP